MHTDVSCGQRMSSPTDLFTKYTPYFAMVPYPQPWGSEARETGAGDSGEIYSLREEGDFSLRTIPLCADTEFYRESLDHAASVAGSKQCLSINDMYTEITVGAGDMLIHRAECSHGSTPGVTADTFDDALSTLPNREKGLTWTEANHALAHFLSPRFHYCFYPVSSTANGDLYSGDEPLYMTGDACHTNDTDEQ